MLNMKMFLRMCEMNKKSIESMWYSAAKSYKFVLENFCNKYEKNGCRGCIFHKSCLAKSVESVLNSFESALTTINNKKYYLTDECVTLNGVNLYRIVSLKNFNGIKIGDTGGFIQHEKNLSHVGDC